MFTKWTPNQNANYEEYKKKRSIQIYLPIVIVHYNFLEYLTGNGQRHNFQNREKCELDFNFQENFKMGKT